MKLTPEQLAEIRELSNDKRITSHSPLIYRQAKMLAKTMEAALDHITALEDEKSALRNGLAEALEWNWLDDDWPIDVRKRPDELLSKQEQES